jgi:hypothetical protein
MIDLGLSSWLIPNHLQQSALSLHHLQHLTSILPERSSQAVAIRSWNQTSLVCYIDSLTTTTPQ